MTLQLVMVISTNFYRVLWQIQDFPKVGVPTLRGRLQHTILPIFPKTNEIERILTWGGEGLVPRDSP